MAGYKRQPVRQGRTAKTCAEPKRPVFVTTGSKKWGVRYKYVALGHAGSASALAGRAPTRSWPHPCDDDRRLAVAVDLTGVIIERSLLERASDLIPQSNRLQYCSRQ